MRPTGRCDFWGFWSGAARPAASPLNRLRLRIGPCLRWKTFWRSSSAPTAGKDCARAPRDSVRTAESPLFWRMRPACPAITVCGRCRRGRNFFFSACTTIFARSGAAGEVRRIAGRARRARPGVCGRMRESLRGDEQAGRHCAHAAGSGQTVQAGVSISVGKWSGARLRLSACRCASICS